MENIIYNSMISANRLLNKQTIIANNLANISTSGFKEDFMYLIKKNHHADIDLEILSQIQEKEYHNFSSGFLDYTHRNLDIFIKRNGWLAVKDNSGKEAYTKNGHLMINANGQLVAQNHPIIGRNTPIQIPPKANIKILSNGEIINTKYRKNNIIKYKIGELKLVTLPIKKLIKKNNGLFYIDNSNINTRSIPHDSNIKIVSGALEKSNVNLTKNMIDMMSNARQFDMQMKMISTYDQNTEYANQLLNINS
ncbi:flagellar basal-body rod protein FlgF [Buchnera aphidicola]|uniref:flagellar basal-body rod protein FlgF n=1 Tax=Buchnera aphidicola TaxID=9 RepID=UPI003464851F